MSYDANEHIENIQRRIKIKQRRIRGFTEEIQSLIRLGLYQDISDISKDMAEEAYAVSVLIEIMETFLAHSDSAAGASKALIDLKGEMLYGQTEKLFREYQMLILDGLNDKE